jgi:hypothetical protein
MCSLLLWLELRAIALAVLPAQPGPQELDTEHLPRLFENLDGEPRDTEEEGAP